MNEKQSKKIRQLFRKNYRMTAEELAKNQVNMIKPKPSFFPMWLWVRLLGIFIRIKIDK
jgi:hypothetical protein